jgi:hypothetical protein
VVKQNNKQKNERKSMNDKFDELAKGLAQSATRRQALKKFGVGLAGLALACFGLANTAEARKVRCSKAGEGCSSARGNGPFCCPGLVCLPTSYFGIVGVCTGPL